jgi:hypothetical protein
MALAFKEARAERTAIARAHPCEVDEMSVPRDPYLQEGPLPTSAPRDPNADTVLDESERGKDAARGEVVDSLTHTPARPLTDEEEDAAEHDPGRPARTYAPASARVPKPPAPGDERLIEQGQDLPPSPDATRHPGDSSDPSERR